MSVRPTQTKSGYPRRSRQPYPSDGQEPTLDPGPDPAVSPGTALAADLTGPSPAAAVAGAPPSRVDRRAARRMRRNLSIVCGLVVAVCLVLTILIVNMARTRPSGFAPPPGSVLSARSATPAPHQLSTIPSSRTRDAQASEGGNR